MLVQYDGDAQRLRIVLRDMGADRWDPSHQRVWHPFVGNPVLRPEAPYERWMEEGNLYAPAILKVDGRYWMFYGAQNPEGHDQIHLAWSSDGLHWTRYEGNPILPAGQANHVNDPTVVRVGGRWYLYYSLAPVDELDTIHLAISEDGLHWEPQGEVLSPGPLGTWDSLKVGRPSVLYENGRFVLYYDGTEADPEHPTQVRPNTGRHVGVAYSSDGVHFEKHPTPIYRHAGAVDVARVGESIVMLMESREGTRWALSRDGLTFEPQSLLLSRSGETYDRYGHVTPMLLVEDGRWTAFYYGTAEGLPTPGPADWNRNRIGVAFPQKGVQLLTLAGEPIPHRCRALDRTTVQVEVWPPVPDAIRLRVLSTDGETLLWEQVLEPRKFTEAIKP